MSARAIVGSSLLLVAAACSYAPSAEPPRPIKPEDGPKASIRVQFTGANIYRQLEPSFIVDENAFVMVGHLGGDGMIRVLYPTSPSAAASRVEAGKTIRVARADAMYDADPSLFNFATRPYRRMSAEMDSYDGLGHGYVFLIASRYPLNFEPAMDGREFGEMDVADYGDMVDPRLAVRRFADVIAGGPYTLKFAAAHSTQTYGSSYCGGHLGYSSFSGGYWGGRRPYRSGYFADHSFGSTMIVPIYWGALVPSFFYVSPWEAPLLHRAGMLCGGMSYYRVFRVASFGRNVYPWIEPPIFVGGGGGAKPATKGRSSFERPTIVTRLADGPNRAARPRGRATALSTTTTTTTVPTRTRAASFDRPGPTRVFEETPRPTYRRSYVAGSSGWTSARGSSSRGTTSSSDISGKTTHEASGGGGGSASRAGGGSAARAPSRNTPTKY